VAPRAGLTPQKVVEAALAIVDESGPDALTLARVAERTGVATPSLYKHVEGLADLLRLVKLRVLGEVDEALRAATIGRSGEEALRALAVAYRDYLRAHPHRHPFVEVAPDDPATTVAADRAVEVAAAVLDGYGLSGPDAVHAIRCLRAAVYGFTHLEAIGGFGRPEDIDTTFAHLLDMVTGGVSTLAASHRPGQPPSVVPSGKN
jgi:AcrR family transcriptional regulator